jgi:hypothetical protein
VWVTGTLYQARDVVSNSGTWYIALDTHTSGATFAGDLAAHWRVYQGVLAADLSDTASAALGDALMGVKRDDLSGSVATTQHEINKGAIIDVARHYGLVLGAVSGAQRIANGTALNAALVSAKAVNSALQLPAGVIEYSGSLVSQNGVNVRGFGNNGELPGLLFLGTTLKYFGGGVGYALDMLGTAVSVSTRVQCCWSDMTFDGAGAPGAGGCRIGWNMRSTPLLRNVSFVHFEGHGQYSADWNWDVTFENVRFDLCGTVGNSSAVSVPATITTFNRINYVGCTVEASGSATSDAGGFDIRSVGATLNIVGCEIEANLGTQQCLIINMVGVTFDANHMECVNDTGPHYNITFSNSTGVVRGGHQSGAGVGSTSAIRATDGSKIHVSGVDFAGWASTPLIASNSSSIHSAHNTGKFGITLDATSQAWGQIAPRVSANKNSADQTGVATGVFTKVTFGTELYDVTGSYAANAYTPQTIGIHHIEAAVLWATMTAIGDRMDIAIYLNGSLHKNVTSYAGAVTQQATSISADVRTTATTDFIEIYARQGSGTGKTIAGAATDTWFSARFLDKLGIA